MTKQVQPYRGLRISLEMKHKLLALMKNALWVLMKNFGKYLQNRKRNSCELILFWLKWLLVNCRSFWFFMTVLNSHILLEIKGNQRAGRISKYLWAFPLFMMWKVGNQKLDHMSSPYYNVIIDTRLKMLQNSFIKTLLQFWNDQQKQGHNFQNLLEHLSQYCCIEWPSKNFRNDNLINRFSCAIILSLLVNF